MLAFNVARRLVTAPEKEVGVSFMLSYHYGIGDFGANVTNTTSKTAEEDQ